MRKFSTRRVFVCPFAGLGLLLVLAQRVDATSYTIATLADDTVVNGNCTLREAIRAADTNFAVDACAAGGSADTITLPNGTYPFSGQENLSGSGSLTIQSQTLNPFSVSIDLANAGRFLSLQGGGSFVLDGLEIKNGQAPAPFFQGGAIFASSVALEIRNFRFLSNHANGSGGALEYHASTSTANLYVHDGAFLSNSVPGTASNSSVGGAVSLKLDNGSDADFRDVSFVANSAYSDSGFGIEGGAFAVEATSSTTLASCSRCNFQNNSATSTVSSAGASGAFYTRMYNGSTTQLLDCRFLGNVASDGGLAAKAAAIGGSGNSGSALLLERLFVDYNGGTASSSSTFDIVFHGVGGTLTVFDSQLTFGAAGGIKVSTNSVAVLGHLTIADYPTTGAALISNGGLVMLENSIVALNTTDLTTSGAFTSTTNFVGGNPLFLDRPNGNYHLSASSPAIGGGTNGAASVRLADLDHRGRIVGAATDIGCYEFDGLFADDFEVRDTGSWSSAAP